MFYCYGWCFLVKIPVQVENVPRGTKGDGWLLIQLLLIADASESLKYLHCRLFFCKPRGIPAPSLAEPSLLWTDLLRLHPILSAQLSTDLVITEVVKNLNSSSRIYVNNLRPEVLGVDIHMKFRAMRSSVFQWVFELNPFDVILWIWIETPNFEFTYLGQLDGSE